MKKSASLHVLSALSSIVLFCDHTDRLSRAIRLEDMTSDIVHGLRDNAVLYVDFYSLLPFFFVLLFALLHPQAFAILFFFMLFILGIGSNIAMCSCIITILRDRFKWLKAWQAAVGLATAGFSCGLIYVTPVSEFQYFAVQPHIASSCKLVLIKKIAYL